MLGSCLISVIVPIYREEDNVFPLAQRLEEVFRTIGYRWELIFALDPSPDRTKEKILQLIEKGYPIRLVTFSRRIGKPLSLLAGLDHSQGDAGVVIDADLQDPPELIAEMVNKWQEGFKVVIAQRRSRTGENFFYLKCAELFYWIMEKIAEVKIPRNTGDFRLLDARVISEICRHRERHGFLRGLTALAGFSTAVIPFDRDPRFKGRGQISITGAVNIALDGIVPFSRTPLRAMIVLGGFYVLLAKFAAIAWLLWSIFGGFASHWPIVVLFLVIFGMSGLIVACLGILGEYLVRTYEESRHRPLYIVDDILESETLDRKVSLKQDPSPPGSSNERTF